MKFEVGDKVIYPNHGLGVVRCIETRTIMGTTCGFYSLRMADSDTTVLVPLDNVDGVGLRRAIGDKEVKKLFTLIGNGKIDNHQNWKGRFKDNSDKMRTGSIYDVIDVLKNLTFLAKSKNLSFREKRMLDRAKFLVVSEISEVVGDTAEAIDEKVNEGPRPLLRESRPGHGPGQGGEGQDEGDRREGGEGPRRRPHPGGPRVLNVEPAPGEPGPAPPDRALLVCAGPTPTCVSRGRPSSPPCGPAPPT